MKSNSPEQPSDLRQWIDVIGAQFSPQPTGQVDPRLVLKTCQLISMHVLDKTKPIPDDVFAEGWNDQLARVTLSSMTQAIVQMLQAQMNAAVRAKSRAP